MARRTVVAAGVAQLIRKAIRAAGSQQAWANQIGVSQEFLSAILRGRKRPSPKVLAALGLQRNPESFSVVED